MAPTKSKRQSKAAAKQADSDAESDDELSQSQGASQEMSMKALQNAMQAQKEKSEARRVQREQEIEANRKQRIAKVQQKMEECRRNHEASIQGARKPKIDRLRALLAKKRELEAELTLCYKQIDDWQDSTLQQVQVALRDRLDDLDD